MTLAIEPVDHVSANSDICRRIEMSSFSDIARYRGRMYDAATFPASSPTALGIALRSLRKRRNLTQDELAKIVGIQRSYLSQLENGDVSEQLKRVFDLIIALSGELRLLDRAS